MAKTKKKKAIGLTEISDGNKEILFDILKREGISSFTVEFDGYGDDGSLEDSDLPQKIADIVVEGSRISQGHVWHNGERIEKWKEDCTVEQIIESLCHEVLCLYHDGWEINEGSHGEFVFDVEKRTAHLDFNERYVESKLHEYDF